MDNMVGIYVLPTEEGKPPRAILTAGGGEIGDPVSGPLVTWSVDAGCWTMGEMPVPEALGSAITEHARNLGVPGF